MMKIIASLFILGLCANVCFASFSGVAPVSSGQSGAFSGSVLNSTAIKVINVGNATDAANWDSSATTNNGAGVQAAYTWFGAGATNDTSYVWGIPDTGYSATAAGTVITTIRKRTLNNTIVGWGNDTSEASVIGDTTVATSIQSQNGAAWATGPGYLAAVSTGTDGATTANKQVWVTIISGASGSATSIKLTTTADVVSSGSGASATPAVGTSCTSTAYEVGDIFYDWDSEAFFYTYYKTVETTTNPNTAGACDGVSTYASTIYVGATYANGSTYWASPLAINPIVPANSISTVLSGVDNSNFASYVFVVYQDSTVSPNVIYISKTSISTNTSSAGSFSALVTTPATSGTQNSATSTYLTYMYTPVSVWSSNFTYGVAVAVRNGSQTQAQYTTSSSTFTYVYSVLNFLNGSTTGVDSGLSFTGAYSGTGLGLNGFQLNTGYALLSSQMTSATTYTYTLGTFFANGTVNSTATTVATFTYPTADFYEDVNGTLWVGWTDVDTANSAAGNGVYVYAGYLAKFIGQIEIDGANVLSALSAIVVFVLASIFVF